MTIQEKLLTSLLAGFIKANFGDNLEGKFRKHFEAWLAPEANDFKGLGVTCAITIADNLEPMVQLLGDEHRDFVSLFCMDLRDYINPNIIRIC